METSKPLQSISINEPPYATISPSAPSKNTVKPSRQRANDHSSNEPPREEAAGSRPSQAEKVARRGTKPSGFQSRAVDPPSLAQPAAIQDDYLPLLLKLVQPESGRSLAPQALEVTNTYSSRTSEMALGEARKPSRSILKNEPPYATTSPSTPSTNIAKPVVSIQRVNDHTSDEPSREEISGFRPLRAEKVARRGTKPSSSQSRAVDSPSLAQTPTIQDDRLPLPPKVRPTPGRSLTHPALKVTNTYSSGTSKMELGERQVPRGIPAPSEEPNFPNEAVPYTTKGGDPLNEQPAPVNVSSPVRHFAVNSNEPSSLPTIALRPVVLTIPHRLQITLCHLPFPQPNTVSQLLRRLLLQELIHLAPPE